MIKEINKDQLKKLLEQVTDKVFFRLYVAVYPPKNMKERDFSIKMKNIARKLTGILLTNIDSRTSSMQGVDIPDKTDDYDWPIGSKLSFAYPASIGKHISRYEYYLLDCCDALHGSVCGTGDRLQAQRALTLYNFLLCRLNDWHKSISWQGAGVNSEIYDEAVKRLCEVSCNEYVTSKHLEQDMKDFEEEVMRNKMILTGVDFEKGSSNGSITPSGLIVPSSTWLENLQNKISETTTEEEWMAAAFASEKRSMR
jgi:hypothetical protein